MARPRKTINEKQVIELARIHCTLPEIAAVTGVSKRTLIRRFGTVIKKGRRGGKACLRRIQYRLAEKGNATMAIWLGKQLLGQSDRHEHTGRDRGAMEMKHTFDVDGFIERIRSAEARKAANGNGAHQPVHSVGANGGTSRVPDHHGA